MFSTKERDFSTGLDYFGFRYYDAVLGKFITRDPSGYPDGPNNYLYVNNNPINCIDPLGLERELIGFTYAFVNPNSKEIYVGSTYAEVSRFEPKGKQKPHHKIDFINKKDTKGLFKPVYAENVKTFEDAKTAMRIAESENFNNFEKAGKNKGYTMLNDHDPIDELNPAKKSKINEIKKKHNVEIRHEDTFRAAGNGKKVDVDKMRNIRNAEGNIKPRLAAERYKKLATVAGNAGAAFLTLWAANESLTKMSNLTTDDLLELARDIASDELDGIVVAGLMIDKLGLDSLQMGRNELGRRINNIRSDIYKEKQKKREQEKKRNVEKKRREEKMKKDDTY